MPVFAALLRAVNVGGTGKLPMSELRSLCIDLGFGNVRTYIQSGNLLVDSDLGAGGVQSLLERALRERMGRDVPVFVRTPRQLREIVDGNPYPEAPPNRVLVLFLDRTVPTGTVEAVDTPGGERLTARDREIYIFFPEGQGRSKLKVPLAGEGTARNLNTVARLADMGRED